MTTEERDKHEKGITLLNEITKSVFYFEPLEGLDTIRSLMTFGTDAEFQEYLKSRHGRVFCNQCSNAAEFIERMKTDVNYKVPICMACRDNQVRRRYAKLTKRRQAETSNYKITADAARAKAKGFIVVDETGKS